MTYYPKNPALGQVIQSDVSDENPDMGFVAHVAWTAAEAVAADTDGILEATTDLGTGAANVITTFDGQPPCPRNITATVDDATGDDADIKAVQVIVVGTNINDEVITETLPAFTVNTAGTVTGSKAFKTVTSVTIPAGDSPYDVITTIGWGDKLGLPYARATLPCINAFLASVLEATAPTVAFSATALESNTIDLSSDLNGTVVDAYFVV